MMLSILLSMAIWICYCADNYTVLVSNGISAQMTDYTNNRTAISILSNYTVIVYPAGSNTVYVSINTQHKAQIKQIAFNPNGTIIATGGLDFIVNVYKLSTPSTYQCQFITLRGDITQLKFLNDGIRLVGVTTAGYAYLWNITSCTEITRRIFTGQYLTSVAQNIATSQLWISNYVSTIYRVSISTLLDSAASITVASTRLINILQVDSTGYMGVCSEVAFHLYANGTFIHTRNNLASSMTRCRISPNWQGGYFITTASSYQQMFTIWKLELASPYTWLIRVQPDDGRHIGKPHTAQLYVYQYNIIYVTSSSRNSKYIRTIFGDQTTTFCDPGTTSSLRNTGSWKCTLCIDTYNNQACMNCSTDNDCQICYENYYLSSGNCIRCPQTCYTCTSLTTCTSCQPNYVLSAGSCVTCSIINCLKCQSNSICQLCLDGYYLPSNQSSCIKCFTTISNCQYCSSATTCTRCQPLYKLTSPTQCDLCSTSLTGCTDCLTSTYCDTCDPNTNPYYRVNGTNRYCQSSCYYLCLTCNFYYDDCLTCDANRTRYYINATSKYSCQCNTNYFLNGTVCITCSDYISNCNTCTNVTYCSACAATYYFNPSPVGSRTCLSCSYLCLTCITNYYDCQTCNTTANRVLLSSRCPCVNNSYYQANLSDCIKCSVTINACLTCSNSTYCNSCASSYYLNTPSANNQDCQPCISTCLTCSTSNNHCLTCNSTQNRVYNNTSFTCVCQTGYYQNGVDICNSCSVAIASCSQCSNSTVCLVCSTNYYFGNSSQLSCAACQSTCLTCSVYITICSTCNSTMNRIFNNSTKQCVCNSSYFQNNTNICPLCSTAMSQCSLCTNSTVCLQCSTNYYFANSSQTSCVVCNAYCLTCSNYASQCASCDPTTFRTLNPINNQCECMGTNTDIGTLICSTLSCDSTRGQQPARTKCVCKAGYYLSNGKCLQYKMGSYLKRGFTVSYYLTQSYQNGSNYLILEITFGTKTVQFPNGINSSLNLTINNQLVTNYTTSLTANILTIAHMPNQPIPNAQIHIQFLTNKVYDEEQYQPLNPYMEHTFIINMYSNQQSFQSISNFFTNYFIPILRYTVTMLVILGNADCAMMLSSIIHIFPLYLILNLSPSPLLFNMLGSLATIHHNNLLIFPYQSYIINKLYSFGIPTMLRSFGFPQSIISNKLIDLIAMGVVVMVYGFMGRLILNIINLKNGKLKSMLTSKFIERSYSTASSTILLFLIPLTVSASITFYADSYHPFYNPSPSVTSYYSIITSLAITSLYLIGIFLHRTILQNLSNESKIEDSYYGVLKSNPYSNGYLLSMMIHWVFISGSVAYLPSSIILSLSSILLIYNLTYYRKWQMFPNKLIYFCRLFIALSMAAFNSVFIVYYISLLLPLPIIHLLMVGYIATIAILISILSAIILTILNAIISIRRILSAKTTIMNQLASQSKDKKRNKSIIKIQYIQNEKQDTVYSAKNISMAMKSMNVFKSNVITTNSIFKRNKKVLID